MSLEPEQIGDLTYVPNPDYPYELTEGPPPHYWMTEQSGQLAEAVEVYFSGEKLAPAQIDLLKQYLRQYLERVVMTGDANRKVILQQIEKLKKVKDVENFVEEVAEYGVEPF